MKPPKIKTCMVCGFNFPSRGARKRCSPECSNIYEQSQTHKDSMELYRQKPENREKARQYAKTYDQLPENKERRKYRRGKPENKEKRRQEMKAYHSLSYVKKRRHMQYLEKKNKEIK